MGQHLYKQGYKEPIIANSPSGKVSEKAQKLQEAQMQKALAKKKIEIETARKEEALKNSKWTRDDLFKLVYEQEKILDKDNSGDPQSFSDDVTLIEAQIAKEKGQIKLEGIEKDKINPHGMDFLYGLILQEHIINRGFYIEINDKYQPILHDNLPPPERTAQLQGLQAQLDKLEFGVDRNHRLRKNDNTSKIATYLGALAYHSDKSGKNLINYRATLEKEIPRDPNQPLTSEEIMKSDLQSGQKSFLLAWRDRKNDRNLIKIQEDQKTFVEESREKCKEKSQEEHEQEFEKNPIRKSIQLFGAGAIGIGILILGIKKFFFDKDGAVSKIFGALALLVGGYMTYSMGDKAWQALGGPEMINQSKQPINIDRANDNPYNGAAEKMPKQFEGMKKKITLMHERLFSGPDEWTPLLMKKDVGPKIATYPAGALLYALSADGDDKTKYQSYEKNPKMGEIKDTLGKLKSSEKNTLLELMTEAWGRQKEMDPTKVADDITKDNSDPKKLTLTTMIGDIDDRDNWWNTLPQVSWFRGPYFSPLEWNTQKTEALKIMAGVTKDKNDPKIMQSNVDKWGNLTLDQIEKRFINEKQAEDKIIDQILGNYPDKTDTTATLTRYFRSLDIPDTINKKTTTLRDFLTQ